MIVTLPDIIGDGLAHAIAPGTIARWVQFAAALSNVAPARVGDSNVSAYQGVPLSAGSSMLFPPIPSDARDGHGNRMYDLGHLYYKIQSGDVISVTYCI